MELVGFTEAHARAVAGLVAASAAAARRVESRLPPVLEDLEAVAQRIVTLGDVGLSVVALDGGDVAGFLGALPYRLWDRPGAYVPEWAFAVADESVVHPLYDAAAKRWAGAGAVTHAVSMLSFDRGVEDAWHALGFGRVLVHAVREVSGASPPAGVRRATIDDREALAELDYRLWVHLGAPPTLRIHPEAEPEEIDDLLADPSRPVWLADVGDDTVGFVSGALRSDDAPVALNDRSVGHVIGAYVTTAARSSGVGRRLVAAAEAWIAGQGRDRVAVEYESANLEAARAWTAMGFRPVVHVLVRRTV